MRRYAKKDPVKLRQVGLQHDIAHAKVGVLDEDAANEKRKKKRKQKKQTEKDASKNTEMTASVDKLKAALSEMEAQLKRYEEKANDEKNDSPSVSDDAEKNGVVSDETGGGEGVPVSEDKAAKEATQMPGDSEKIPSGAWSGTAVIHARPEDTRSSHVENQSREGPQATVEVLGADTDSKENSEEGDGEKKTEPSKEQAKQAIEETPREVRREKVAADDLEQKATATPSVANTPDVSDSESDSESEEDPKKEPKWNPVCVLGLRVYSEDKEVQVRIEKQDKRAALETSIVAQKE